MKRITKVELPKLNGQKEYCFYYTTLMEFGQDEQEEKYEFAGWEKA